MSARQRFARILGGSGALFVAVYASLSAIRVWDFVPSVATQSAVVRTAAVVLFLGVAAAIFSGWGFIDGWILASGPCFGFVLNLFVTTPGGLDVAGVVFALVGGFVTSGILATSGCVVGAIARKVEAGRWSEA